MSKPRYDWWPYVKGMIRRYPALCRRLDELHRQPIAPDRSGMPRSGAESRPTETAAVRELPTTAQREYEAVRRAIEQTRRYRNGVDRLKVIRLVFWDRSHTLEGASLQVPCGYDTAQTYHEEFIRLVASNYGLMDF